MARRLSIVPISAAPQPQQAQMFEVACACGFLLTGPRQVQHQVLSCPECGQSVFVLPADCYLGAPQPSSARRMVPAGDASEGVIDKLNRLAFWTRLREKRTSLTGTLRGVASRIGSWVRHCLTRRD